MQTCLSAVCKCAKEGICPLWNPRALARTFRVFAKAIHDQSGTPPLKTPRARARFSHAKCNQNGQAPSGLPTRVRACKAISQRRLPRQGQPYHRPFTLPRKRQGATRLSLHTHALKRLGTNRLNAIRQERCCAPELAA